jgi:hypothetical protein
MSFPRLGLRRKNDLPPRSLSSPTVTKARIYYRNKAARYW